MYEKEVLYSYLLEKKTELKRKKAELEALKELKKELDAEEVLEKHANDVAQFVQAQGRMEAVPAERKRAVSSTSGRSIAQPSKRAKVVTEADLKKSSPWMPQFAPEAGVAGRETITDLVSQKLPERPGSPITGDPLRMKHIYELELEKDEFGKFICAVSKKEMKYQQTIAITKSKKVMTKDSFDRLFKAQAREKDKKLSLMRCPVTNIPFKRKDVIHLKTAVSSFASKGNTTKRQYRPNML